MNNKKVNPLLTLNQVAKMFKVNPETVRNWDRKGRLKSVRTLGGHRRYSLEDVKNFKK